MVEFILNPSTRCEACRECEEPLPICETCKVTIHSACYGLPDDPPIPWLCDRCASQAPPQVQCKYCHGVKGALKHIREVWAHIICLSWLHCIRWNPRSNDLTELGQPSERECVYCHRSSRYCLQCKFSNCTNSFHPKCAQEYGIYSLTTQAFMVNCHEHFKGNLEIGEEIRAVYGTKPVTPSNKSLKYQYVSEGDTLCVEFYSGEAQQKPQETQEPPIVLLEDEDFYYEECPNSNASGESNENSDSDYYYSKNSLDLAPTPRKPPNTSEKNCMLIDEQKPEVAKNSYRKIPTAIKKSSKPKKLKTEEKPTIEFPEEALVVESEPERPKLVVEKKPRREKPPKKEMGLGIELPKRRKSPDVKVPFSLFSGLKATLIRGYPESSQSQSSSSSEEIVESESEYELLFPEGKCPTLNSPSEPEDSAEIVTDPTAVKQKPPKKPIKVPNSTKKQPIEETTPMPTEPSSEKPVKKAPAPSKIQELKAKKASFLKNKTQAKEKETISQGTRVFTASFTACTGLQASGSLVSLEQIFKQYLRKNSKVGFNSFSLKPTSLIEFFGKSELSFEEIPTLVFVNSMSMDNSVNS